MALNVSTDLDYFDLIVPCGIADKEVTSLARELGRSVDHMTVENVFIRHFSDVFGRSAVEEMAARPTARPA